MSIEKSRLEQALENCSRDPIHIPGKIQSFGLLLAADKKFDRIEFVSQNVDGLFGKAAEELVGAPTSVVFSQAELHEIRNSLGHDTIQAQRELLPSKRVGDTEYQMSVHQRGDRSILELMPERLAAEDRFRLLERARSFLATPMAYARFTAFFEEASERLRWITDFDRVMFYRFLPDGSGEVIAESRQPGVESYLGLRFPSSDIPPIARRLYVSTPIRELADIQADDVPLLGPEGVEPLDLSLAVLRGKDEVHRQYLTNMGIACTQTVPVVVNGELWGLFASHNLTPKIPDPSALGAAELAGKLISLRVQHAIESQQQTSLQTCLKIANRLIVVDDSELAASDYWPEVRSDLSSMIPSDGVLFSIDGHINTGGQVPSPAACRAVLALADASGSGVASYDDLAERLPGVDWMDTGGALIVAPQGHLDVRVVFFRNLVEREVKWAGQPEKEIMQEGDAFKLNPRNSFETYLETVNGRSDEWSADDLEVARAMREAMMQVISVQASLRENRHRLGLMVRELNHRVRNILSLVQSLSRQSREESRSVEAYAEALEKRIVALAGAHDLLTRPETKGALLADIVALELSPFAGATDRITAEGPNIVLTPDASSVMALLIHELTSNAVKYGALSTTEGKIRVTWMIENDGVALFWQEADGPPVAEPVRQGFGRSIIQDAIPFEFKGKADLSFLPSGVVGKFWLPGDVIAQVAGPAMDINPTASFRAKTVKAVPAASLDKALVVEDNFMVAALCKRLLLEEGFEQVDSASSVEEAVSCLETNDYQFCLLDVNLRGKLSAAIARHLTRRSIPFVIATGYGSDGHGMVEDYRAMVISKPIDADDLRHALHRVLQDG